MQFGPIIILVGDEAQDYIHRQQDLRAVRIQVEGIAVTAKKLAKDLNEVVVETNPAPSVPGQ